MKDLFARTKQETNRKMYQFISHKREKKCELLSNLFRISDTKRTHDISKSPHLSCLHTQLIQSEIKFS